MSRTVQGKSLSNANELSVSRTDGQVGLQNEMRLWKALNDRLIQFRDTDRSLIVSILRQFLRQKRLIQD